MKICSARLHIQHATISELEMKLEKVTQLETLGFMFADDDIVVG